VGERADGSDEKVVEILRLALGLGVIVVHGSNRAKLGRAYCGKFGPKVSVVSILNFQGQEEMFGALEREVGEQKR
jgi:hypothetical protein